MFNKDLTYRYRLFYARTELAAFTAHLDLMHTFQRAAKRADLPMAYTKGYNPRPIMEFALPIGVGIETRHEPFDIILTDQIEADHLKKRLNEKLPQGVAIVEAIFLKDKIKNLMGLVQSAEYQISAKKLGQIVENQFTDPNLNLSVSRERKGKLREYKIRDYIQDIEVIDQNTVVFTSKAGSSENLRPDLFLQAFVVAGLLDDQDALDAIIIRNKVFLTGDRK